MKKTDKKIYKAGTKGMIKTTVGYAGCNQQHKFVIEYDMTQSEMDALCWEYALEDAQPEGWFVAEGEED